MLYLGWDIGGVHLKVSRLERASPGAWTVASTVEPFEIWREPAALESRLRALLADQADPDAPVAHAVTMTAELSDVFPRRSDGVRVIVRASEAALRGAPIRFFDIEGRFVTSAFALDLPDSVAAANWLATARLAALLERDALLIDVGSTTTDIVPIVAGSPRPEGRSDTDRLLTGELVYSGCLRTPPSSLTDRVPLRGSFCRVSPEFFTCTADVYMVLGKIDEAQYTVPTPDGRGRTRADSLARLARLVCSDPGGIGEEGLLRIAAHIEDRQIDQIASAIREVVSRRAPGPRARAIVAGAGAFLAEMAAARAGLETIRLARLLPEIVGGDWDIAAPSAALAILLAGEDGAGPARGGAA